MISSAGASRRSSVSGLNARPQTATVRPSSPPSRRSSLRTKARRPSRLMSSTARSSCGWQLASAAMYSSACTSLGRQDPPKPMPACREWGPMRLSKPIPAATCRTSAPSSSQICATSLMKEMRVARKALAAYLIISAVRRSVSTSGAPRGR